MCLLNEQHDVKGHNVRSSSNQIYRNMQGFIVMCDLSDEQSVKMVPSWIQMIEERSTVHERVIMVLANKCDLAGTELFMVELERDLEQRFH